MIREKKYDQRRIGCNLLFFKHDSIKCCIDATEDEDGYGRLINHSVANANLQMKIFVFDKIPHVIFTASKEISFGEEVLYNYGESRKENLLFSANDKSIISE